MVAAHAARIAARAAMKRSDTTTQRLAHIADLAAIALKGNEPEGGVEYLFDALELLRGEIRPLRRLKPRAAA